VGSNVLSVNGFDTQLENKVFYYQPLNDYEEKNVRAMMNRIDAGMSNVKT